MCVQTFHMVNIDVPAGVGAPPLDKQLKTIMLGWTALYKMVGHNLCTNLSNLFPFFLRKRVWLVAMTIDSCL